MAYLPQRVKPTPGGVFVRGVNVTTLDRGSAAASGGGGSPAPPTTGRIWPRQKT